ncbi:integral membrane protein [Pseudohyphozyma bogoriensis]|nr:integral membrane protein [Pseudohyphozyma bogoriensis]
MKLSWSPLALATLAAVALAEPAPSLPPRSASALEHPLARREPAPFVPPALVRRHGNEDHDSPVAVAVHEHSSVDAGESTHHDAMHDAEPESPAPAPVKMDAHSHAHSDAAPLKHLNETEILLWHSPDTPAYYQLTEGRGVLIAHIVFHSLAFFVLLPLAIMLKAGESSLSLLPQAGFVLFTIFGTLFGSIYNAGTPNLYEGSSHSRLGWIVVLLVLALNAWDAALFALKLKRWILSSKQSPIAPTSALATADEEQRLVEKDDEEEIDLADHRASPLMSSPVEMSPTEEVNWSSVHSHGEQNRAERSQGSSTVSDDTLFDHHHHHNTASSLSRPASLRNKLASYGSGAHMFLQRVCVLLAYVQVLSGIAVFSGSCKAEYGNGCMAHTIKGSIFVWYGLLTFARYIGAFSALGWAWNKRPNSSKFIVSAEFVESAVCFAYGASNTWLERLGAAPGAPYNVKTIQHISIAVMFWFAGGLGMLLESRRVRSFLSQSAILESGRHVANIAEPASAGFSFNPFPAMVIGVTGVAMAAHHQTYQFQVDIHALWGLLLGGFAAFRFLTYFFLYLRPPASILPSRPPTEALAAFCLTCGGVVFILSTEQITFAAMRHQFDDMMAFLNVTVALVCIWFTWTLALFAVKGWALARAHPTDDRSHPHHHRSASMHVPERSRSSSLKPRRLANLEI